MIKRYAVNCAKQILPEKFYQKLRRLRPKKVNPDRVVDEKGYNEFFRTAFRALDFNGIDGDYVEFGCHAAVTFRIAYDHLIGREIRRHMWAFDSFKGLPDGDGPLDQHPRWVPGTMAMGVQAFHETCRKNKMWRDTYTTVEGFYDKTLRELPRESEPLNIAMAYIDCDLYSSTMTVLEFLLPRLKHGMIIAFDDYFCWSAEQVSGERKAMLDIFGDNEEWLFIPYRDFCWAGRSFVVEKASLTCK